MADTRLPATAVPSNDAETVGARPGAISRSIVIYLVAASFVGFCLLPFYVMITTALKREGDIFAWPPVFLFEPTLDSIRAAFFGGRSVIPYLINSAAISAVSTVLATALGSMAAFGLSRFRFSGSASLSFWILSTRMAPPVAFLVPMFIIFRNLGMIDTPLALVVIYTSMNLS